MKKSPSVQPQLSYFIRPLEQEDAPLLAAYYRRNRESHREWSPLAPADFFTTKVQRERLERGARLREEGREIRFGMFTSAAELIGTISLTSIERGVFQNGRFGYSIDAEYMGRGLMTAGLRKLIRYAFEDLGLHRLEANVMPRNAASARVLKKCGFRVIGHSPAMVQINGVWEGHDMYMLLAGEWRAHGRHIDPD
ncbi:MAG: GNAT family protein [Candidatus Kapaibacterium sp.]